MTTFGSEIELKLSKCVCCDQPLNAATCVGEEASPSPGDTTVCLYCGTIMVFADDMLLREASAEEEEEISDDLRVRAIRRAIRAMKS